MLPKEWRHAVFLQFLLNREQFSFKNAVYHLFVCLSVYLSIFVSTHLSVSLLTYLSVLMSIYKIRDAKSFLWFLQNCIE